MAALRDVQVAKETAAAQSLIRQKLPVPPEAFAVEDNRFPAEFEEHRGRLEVDWAKLGAERA